MDLKANGTAWRATVTGKTEIRLYTQTKRNIKQLMEALESDEQHNNNTNNSSHNNNMLDDKMTECVRATVTCMRAREYKRANDLYFDLVIGNARVHPLNTFAYGIHARSNDNWRKREALQSHYFDSERVREWLWSLKRLVTFCQKKYPTDPSKCCL